MTLRISNNGITVNQELVNYINQKFNGIYFNEIYIQNIPFDNEIEELIFRDKIIDVTYPGNGPFLRNMICINEAELNANIINWLKSL